MKALVVGQRSWFRIFWNAITRQDISHGAAVSEIKTPAIGEKELLVRVRSVALVRLQRLFCYDHRVLPDALGSTHGLK